jgi:hypothetical protein
MEDQSKTVSAVNLATDPTKAGIGKNHQLDFQINSLLAMEYSGEKGREADRLRPITPPGVCPWSV